MIGIGDGERSRICPGGVWEFTSVHANITDALDSIPVPEGALYAEIIVPSGGNALNYHGGSNTVDVAPVVAGFTISSIQIAAGSMSHLIPCALVRYLIVDGQGGTVSPQVRWQMASDPR